MEVRTMADYFAYEITIVGERDEVENVLATYNLRGDGPDGYRVQIDDRHEWDDGGSELSFTFTGQGAWDWAEILARDIKNDDSFDVDVQGMVQGGWEPMDI
jgi:hypothetical protein